MKLKRKEGKEEKERTIITWPMESKFHTLKSMDVAKKTF